MAKQRARRGEPPLPAAAVVIRGDLLDPEVLAESATRSFDVYGFYGISVFAETSDLAWTDLAATRLVPVPWLVLFAAGDLQAAGSSYGTREWRPTTTWSTPSWPSSSLVCWAPCTRWCLTLTTTQEGERCRPSTCELTSTPKTTRVGGGVCCVTLSILAPLSRAPC